MLGTVISHFNTISNIVQPSSMCAVTIDCSSQSIVDLSYTLPSSTPRVEYPESCKVKVVLRGKAG